jgi:cytochrome c oxidase assembly protein subunit 15
VALRMLRMPGFAIHGGVLLALLFAQLGLGIANVLLRLPLAIAVAHNAGAALLLVALVVLNFRLFRKSPR